LQKPRDLVSIEVTVRPVLDLTELAIQARYAASLEKMTGDSDEELEQCRQLADAARGEGFRAILAPSAAQEVERVLVIYPEGRASDLRLREGPDRLAVNHGPTPPVDEHGEVIGQIWRIVDLLARNPRRPDALSQAELPGPDGEVVRVRCHYRRLADTCHVRYPGR
jgi:hypothetical protein